MVAAGSSAQPTQAAHRVQFYETDDYLTGVVATFVAEGIAAGEAVLVIATEDHRRRFLADVAARGIDVDAARAGNRFLLLDAEETLARFMVDGTPDRARFRDVLDAAIAMTTHGDAAVKIRAYGEMVDVLWRSGNSRGAIELEELWNEAQRDRSFSLLCAYVMASFYKEPGGLAEICATHTHTHGHESFAAEIAQRIEIERALRESLRDLRRRETELRDFVDNATVGLHWVAEDGTILWANHAELALLGYTAEEYLGHPISEFHADPEVIGDILRCLAADEELHDREARMVAKDGSIRHVLIDSSVYREQGRFIHTRCFTRDVTERRRVEEALSASEARLRAVTDALPVLVSHVGTDLRYRYANQAAEAWFGLPHDALVGAHMRDVLGEEAYAVVAPHVAAALRGETARFERSVPYRHGARFVEATYLPHRDDTGAVSGFVALVADVSERKHLDDERELHLRRTQQLVQVTSAIAEAVTPAQVYSAIVDEVGAALHASSVGLFLVDDDARGARLVRSLGYFDHVKPQLAFTPFEVSPPMPAIDCIRTAQALWIDSRDELLVSYPHLAAMTTPGRAYRVACLPVIARGRAIACIGLTFDDAPPLDAGERDFLRLAARYAGQALERVRLLDGERRSRELAEASAARTTLLSEASRAFTEAGVNVEGVLETICTLLTKRHSDVCIATLLPEHGDTLRPVAILHRDPSVTGRLQEMTAAHPIRMGEGIQGRVAQSGIPMFQPHIEHEQVLAQAHPGYRAWVEERLPHSVIAVPIRVGGEVFGVVIASREGKSQPYLTEDFALIEGLAERAALALQNARLQRADQHARERAELLYGMAREVIGASTVDEVFTAALDAIAAGLGTVRASILTYGDDPIMKFRMWRGLSDGYRAAVEGHSPWARDTKDPRPVVVPDVAADPAMAPYAALFASERIGALAFIPLVSGKQLLGKFMLYYDQPRPLGSAELDLARAIADHVAAAVARFAAVDSLRDTVRFNEMFTGILGHDLRNPLGAIVTAAQLAIARSPGERITKPLSRILTSSTRMTRMIEQLLDFTRVRVGGGIPIAPQPMDVIVVVRQVMEELEDANPDWTLRLETLGSTAGAWDGDRLAQVFSNLVANAIQHGDQAEGVRVRVDGARADRVRIEIHNAGTVPSDLLPSIFEPMSGSQRRRDGSRGLGLGLHVTREIIRVHGGSIDVVSTPAHGTTFLIDLPRSPW